MNVPEDFQKITAELLVSFVKKNLSCFLWLDFLVYC